MSKRRRDEFSSIEDAVDAWHDADTTEDVWVWLGMTWEEYAAEVSRAVFGARVVRA